MVGMDIALPSTAVPLVGHQADFPHHSRNDPRTWRRPAWQKNKVPTYAVSTGQP